MKERRKERPFFSAGRTGLVRLTALVLAIACLSGCGSSKAKEPETPVNDPSVSEKTLTPIQETRPAETVPQIVEVPITPENWEQYFEVVDVVEDHSVIAGDVALYGFGLLYQMKLRDNYAGALDKTRDNTVAFDMTFSECTGLIAVSYEGLSYYDEGDYAAVKTVTAHVEWDPSKEASALVTEQSLMFTKPIDKALGSVANDFRVETARGSLFLSESAARTMENYPLEDGMNLQVEIVDACHMTMILDLGKEQKYITSTAGSEDHHPDYQWTLNMRKDIKSVASVTVSSYPDMGTPNKYITLEEMSSYCSGPDNYDMTDAQVEQSVSGSGITVRVTVPEDSGVDFTQTTHYIFFTAGKLETGLYYAIPRNGIPERRDVSDQSSGSGSQPQPASEEYLRENYQIVYAAREDKMYLTNNWTTEQLPVYTLSSGDTTMYGIQVNILNGMPFAVSYADPEQGYAAMDFTTKVDGLTGLTTKFGIWPVDAAAMKNAKWNLFLLGQMEECDFLSHSAIPVKYKSSRFDSSESSRNTITIVFPRMDGVQGFTFISDTLGGFALDFVDTVLYFENPWDMIRYVDSVWEYGAASSQ